ncbi:6499_t:CDS:2 [Acaulospora colombiana]|uniref:6499_t:CDS:1 n=1 Tax=Acaulospora colombiana TaxID=27376 RepID=A0ACA9KRW4_9GLOM|nr:6499_t:CDS:2 [Acaulospora colombiana]
MEGTRDFLDQATTPKKRKNVFHVTIPKPFRFHTTSRFDFHDDERPRTPTTPLTFGIRDDFYDSPKRPELTIPTSPAITKPKPLQQRPPTPQLTIRTHPVPDFGEPFVPIIKHRVIDLPNFTLPGDEIHKRKSNEIEERLRKELEEMRNARNFKAQPLPSDSPDCLPPRHYYPLTHPKPFKLETESRGEKHQKYFRERLKEMERSEKENQFHAAPIPNLEQQVPKKPRLPSPTKPVEFIFHTDTRMEERRVFDDQRRVRESVADVIREQKRKEEEARNAEEIRRLRAELVHRAQPIRRFAPINIRPSNKRPTKAISPMIGEKRRKIMEEQKRLSLQSDLNYGTSIMSSLFGRPTKRDVELTNLVGNTDSEFNESNIADSDLRTTNTRNRATSELQRSQNDMFVDSEPKSSANVTNSEAVNIDDSNTQKLTAYDGSEVRDLITDISSALQRLVTIDTHSDIQF